MNSIERSCTMLVHSDKQASANEIKEALEGNDTEAKIVAMQKAVTLLLNGEQLPQLFITIVRYVLPSEDHTVQKLLLLYLVRRRRRRRRRCSEQRRAVQLCSAAQHAPPILPCRPDTPAGSD